MRSALIGHTGFIGGNLSAQFPFTESYNSKTIAAIDGREFDLLVCAGITATKWWANQNPVEDRARVDSLLNHLSTVRASSVVIISTVDVYPATTGIDETSNCDAAPNHPYGTNRRYFEKAIGQHFDNVLLARIGGVFGEGLKKNVIYDLLHGNGLEKINIGSEFQYYNVAHLWRDLQRLPSYIRLVNFTSEPLSTADIVEQLFPDAVVGTDPAPFARYDVRTIYSAALGGPDGYLASAQTVMDELARFVYATRSGVAA